MNIYCKEDIQIKENGMKSCFLSLCIFILFTLSLNKDWGNSSVIWWSSIGLFFFAFILTAKTIKFGIPFTIWKVAFLLFSALSLLWAKDTELVKPHLKSLLVYLVILILIYSCIRTKKDIEKVLKIWLMACVVCVCYLLITNSSEIMNANMGGEGNFRLGTEGSWNANSIGLMTSGAALIALYFLKKTSLAIPKILYLCCMGLMIFTSLVTGSRKAIIMILLGICLYLLLTSKGKRVRIMLLILIFASVLYYIIMEVPYFYSIVGWRMEGLFAKWTGNGEVEASAKIREEFIDNAVKVWKQYPIWGCGLDCFRMFNIDSLGRPMYAHNNYVELLADLGVVGFSIYYIGYLYLLTNLFKKIKESDLAKFLLIYLLVVAILEYGFVSYNDLMTQLILMFGFSFVTITKIELKTGEEVEK